jgi:hypothetical protein
MKVFLGSERSPESLQYAFSGRKENRPICPKRKKTLWREEEKEKLPEIIETRWKYATGKNMLICSSTSLQEKKLIFLI